MQIGGGGGTGCGATGPLSSIENKPQSFVNHKSSGVPQKSAVNGYGSSNNTEKKTSKTAAPKSKATSRTTGETKKSPKIAQKGKPSGTTASSSSSSSKPGGEKSGPAKVEKGKSGPATTLRCLEDPTFMFDSSPKPTSGIPVMKPTVSAQPVSKPKGQIRVLEAPSSVLTTCVDKQEPIGFTPPAPVAAPKNPVVGTSHVSESPPVKGAIKVLEAPDKPDPKSPAGRSKASDVLEKAKHRFDKLWGKNKSDHK